MHPAAAEHRGDDANVRQRFRLDVERVAVEDDEVGEVAGQELAAAMLVAREPGGVDGGRLESFAEGESLLGMPGVAAVDRAQNACAGAGPGVELLDRCVGAVCEERAGVPER